MLKKLMKYEFKATGRSILPLYAALCAFALLIRIIFGNLYDISNMPDSFMAIVTFISIFGYGFVMAAVFVATFFIIVQRFHKNLLGDEGYLMHTLPLQPYKNITSKLIVSGVWSIISILVAIFSIFIIAANGEFFTKFSTEFLPELKRSFTVFKINPYILFLEIILCGIAQLSKLILKLYASISIGHLFNKSKILFSLVAFVGISIIENIISSIIMINSASHIHVNTIAASSDNFSFTLSLGGHPISSYLVILLPLLINLIYCCIYFFSTNHILKNNLNLE